MAREQDVAGLSFKEIQVKYALENEPSFMVRVEPPSGIKFYEGPTGANFNQVGGGWQVYITIKTDDSWFKDLF